MAKPFIERNVVLYLFSSDTVKADRAESLLQSGCLISVQVLNEVASVCLRKLKMTWKDVDSVFQTLKSTCEVFPVTLASHEKAVGLAKRFQISLYDANIVATAILCGADTLLSEDMQNGMSMESVIVVNPFYKKNPNLKTDGN
jgi:predicted nucleic acid-binding protein